MSLVTYADLLSAVANWSTKGGLAAQVPDFITWAHQEICRTLRAPVLYARAQVSVNAERIATPAGFLAARSLYLDTSPRRILRLTDIAKLSEETANFVACDYPSHFAVEGTGTLAFAPLFNGSTTGELLYYQAPLTMAAPADTNVVLAKYPFVYLFGALAALYRYMEDDNNADRYGGLFAGMIENINAQEARDASRGPLVGSAGGAVV